jgi:hypothetical protein
MMLRRRIHRGRRVTTGKKFNDEFELNRVKDLEWSLGVGSHPYACRGVETPRTCPKAHGSFVEFETTDSAILFSSP